MASNTPPIIIKTDDGTEVMRVDPSGKVGIGTATPTNSLHVKGSTGMRQNRLYLSGGDQTAIGSWSSLTYNAYHNDANTDWVFPDPTHTAVTIEMDDTNGTPRFQVWNTTPGDPTGWVQRFAIDGISGNVLMGQSGGNVGMGTTTPRNRLGIRATGISEELISFENPAGTTTWHVNQNLGGNNPGLNFVETGVADGRLFIQAGGNVGIGTTAPQANLHVSTPSGFNTPQTQITQTAQDDFARMRLQNSNHVSGEVAFWDIAAGPSDNSQLNFYNPISGNVLSVSTGGVNIVGGASITGPTNITGPTTINGGMEFNGGVGINGGVLIDGSLLVTGAKSFVQDHPDDPTRQIVYVSLEGGESGTYTRGTRKLEEGKAVIDLPEHFGLVTSEDGLSIQLTPRGEWLQLYVVQLTTREVVVQEGQGKSGQFDYLIQGVRKGYEHHEVIREKK